MARLATNDNKNGSRLTIVPTLLKSSPFISRYLLLCGAGLGIGLIFNAIVGYDADIAVFRAASRKLTCPISGGDAFTVLGSLLRFALPEIAYFIFTSLFALTFVCKGFMSASTLTCGFSLGVHIGFYAVGVANSRFSALSRHPVVASIFATVTLSITALLAVLFAAMADANTPHWLSLVSSGRNVVFSKRFFSYLTAALSFFGCAVTVKFIFALILWLLEKL